MQYCGVCGLLYERFRNPHGRFRALLGGKTVAEWRYQAGVRRTPVAAVVLHRGAYSAGVKAFLSGGLLGRTVPSMEG